MNYKKWMVWIIFFVIATIYDYEITNFLYNPNNMFANFFAYYAYIPIVLCLILYFSYEKHKYDTYLGAFFSFYSLYLLFYGMTFSLRAILAICLSIPLYNIIKKVFYKFTGYHESFYFYLKYMSIVIILSFVCVNLIKVVWGRLRYRDMLNASMFTPWYQIHFFSGNASFPSGHTMIASCSLCFLRLKDYIIIHMKQTTLKLIVYSFIISMIISRLMIGAHFLSDTLVAYAIVSIINEFVYKKLEVTNES